MRRQSHGSRVVVRGGGSASALAPVLASACAAASTPASVPSPRVTKDVAGRRGRVQEGGNLERGPIAGAQGLRVRRLRIWVGGGRGREGLFVGRGGRKRT